MRGRLYSGDIHMGPRDRQPTSLVQQSLSVSCALLSPQGLRRAVLCHQHTDLGPSSDGCKNGGSVCLVPYSDTIGQPLLGQGRANSSANTQRAELRLWAPERQH